MTEWMRERPWAHAWPERDISDQRARRLRVFAAAVRLGINADACTGAEYCLRVLTGSPEITPCPVCAPILDAAAALQMMGAGAPT